MNIGQLVEVIETLHDRAIERNRSKKKSTNPKPPRTLIDQLLIFEEKFWTFLIFGFMSVVAFLYLSGQNFVLRDEMAVYQHSQKIFIDWIKERIGDYKNHYEEANVNLDPNLKIIIDLERNLQSGNEAEELVAIVKSSIEQLELIKQFKIKRKQLKELRRIKPLQFVNKCQDLKSINGFGNCFNTNYSIPNPPSSLSLTYSRWIKDSFGKLLKEITFKLKETLIDRAKLIKFHVNRRSNSEESIRSAQSLIAKIKRLLNETIEAIDKIEKIEAVPTHRSSLPFSKKTKRIESVYDKHN